MVYDEEAIDLAFDTMNNFVRGVTGELNRRLDGEFGTAWWPSAKDGVLTEGVSKATAAGLTITRNEPAGWEAVLWLNGVDEKNNPARIVYRAWLDQNQDGPLVVYRYRRYWDSTLRACGG